MHLSIFISLLGLLAIPTRSAAAEVALLPNTQLAKAKHRKARDDPFNNGVGPTRSLSRRREVAVDLIVFECRSTITRDVIMHPQLHTV